MKKLATIALTVALMGLTANAAPIDDVNGNLQVTVDLATGAMSITNVGADPLVYNGMEITSTLGILDPVGWKSIGDYIAAFDYATVGGILGAGAFGIGELGATPFALTEGNPGGAATLAPGGTAVWSMGNPIIPATPLGNVHPGVNFDVFYGIPGQVEPARVTNYVGLGGPVGFPGDSQDNPIDPTTAGNGDTGRFGERMRYSFAGVDVPAGEGRWFDPPMVEAYLYETDGNSEFTAVMLPTDIPAGSDNSFWVNYGLGGNLVLAGELFLFPDGVSSFIVSGIDPAADGGSPIGFPTFLMFDETQVTFSQTGIPEPATMGLMLFGAIGMIARKRRRS